MPDVSVCIVAFKTDPDVLQACISSVRQAQGPHTSLELVVVDNSSDESLKMFRAQADQWVSSSTNLGFSRAANLAVKTARSDWILLLNPDAALQPQSFHALVRAAADAPASSLLCGWLEVDGSVQVDAFMLWWTSTGRMIRRSRYRKHLMDMASKSPLVPTQKVSGGALFARRELLLHLGPFDERFFLYGEDVDLSVRARRAGIGLFAVPGAPIRHVGASSKKNHSHLVEQARVDAAIRQNAYHLNRALTLATRVELLVMTLVGLLPGFGRSSGSTSARISRLKEFRRWGLSLDAPRYSP